MLFRDSHHAAAVRTSLPRSIGEVTKQSSQGLLSTNKCPMQMNQATPPIPAHNPSTSRLPSTLTPIAA